MQRTTSIYGSSSALRGVLLKIGDNFKPTAKITLPVGWKTRDPPFFLNLAYDFSLEKEVIRKDEAEKEAKEKHEHAQKRKELLAASVANPVVANMGADILQPTTVTPSVTTNVSNQSNVRKQEFNYKDFEDDAGSPFEAVELETINDMDVLKSVLQPDVAVDSTGASTSIPQTIQDTNGACVGSSEETAGQSNVELLETRFPLNGPPELGNNSGNPSVYPGMSSSYPRFPSPDQLGSLNGANNGLPVTLAQKPSLPASHYETPPNSTPDIPASHHLNAGADILSIPPTMSTTEKKISSLGAVRVLPATRPPRRPASVPNESLTTDMMSSLPNQARASTSPELRRPVPKPRTKLPPLKDDTHTKPETPPPLPPKKVVGKNKNVESLYMFPKAMVDPHMSPYPSPLPPITPPLSETRPEVNDWRSSLTFDEIQFVRKISAMGFPSPRVARAVKNLGCKEQEVIEFLIAVNDKCSLGYSEEHVEMVLKENLDEKKVVEFLKLITQFKELGFQEEKIFEALKRSECDSQKALDILTCAG